MLIKVASAVIVLTLNGVGACVCKIIQCLFINLVYSGCSSFIAYQLVYVCLYVSLL